MRQLRLVHRTEDGTLVVETTDGGEQFGLPIDAVLRTAIRADQPRHAGDAPAEPAPTAKAIVENPPPIGPREIQVRVRAGESPEELAEAYDMPLDKVLRFAGPVMDERRRIADDSRRARARRGTPEGQIVVFGEAVDERFAAHGIAPEAVAWDARRREDGEWIVTAQWDGGAGRHAAEWTFSRASRSVTPSDETATDLLSDRPIRPIAPPKPAQAAESGQRPSLAAAPPLRAGVVAFPPMPDAHTAPVAVVEEVFDQEAVGEAQAATDDLAGAPAADLPYETRPLGQIDGGFDFDAPPLPLSIVDDETAAARPGDARFGRSRNARRESDEERAARARVPSWDDILLGVRRKD
jgi:hypothetical protein